MQAEEDEFRDFILSSADEELDRHIARLEQRIGRPLTNIERGRVFWKAVARYNRAHPHGCAASR
jgi:hypothetical protein